MNNGKKFENNFKKSVPKDIFYYRFRDGTSSWDKGTKTRFQAKNICDVMLFDGTSLFLLELKSHKGKSLPLSAIRENQVKDLFAIKDYKAVVSGLIVNFSDVGETYFMPIDRVAIWYYHTDRKSIPLSDFRDNCLKIESTKKKVNESYDIRGFIYKYYENVI